MTSKPKYFPVLSMLVLAVFCMTVIPAPAVQAFMLSTDTVLPDQAEATRSQLQELLQRNEVQQALQKQGVDPQEAQARVMALSNAELNEIQGELDALPAGQGAIGAIVGGAVFIFVVLLITDILGFTDVFTFVKSR